jgi:LysM repeat protein
VLRADASILEAGGSVLNLREKVSVLSGNPQTGQVYIASQGDTIQGIASKFYGSAHKWGELYQANGLTNPGLVGGEQLIIPNTPAADPVFIPTDVGAPNSNFGGATR